MVATVLHTGIEHPSLLWIVLSSVVSFVAGLGVGLSSSRVREWLAPAETATAD